MGRTIDIDVGGTFTDCYVRTDDRVITAKVPTTHYDLSVCFRNALESSARSPTWAWIRCSATPT